jgi:hypothetical protein
MRTWLHFFTAALRHGCASKAGVADEPSQPEKQKYEAMNCLECGGVHFVNPLSGKTINEEVLYQKS